MLRGAFPADTLNERFDFPSKSVNFSRQPLNFVYLRCATGRHCDGVEQPGCRQACGDTAGRLPCDRYCSNVLGGTTSFGGGNVRDVPHPSQM
jgi:hypothetical protein